MTTYTATASPPNAAVIADVDRADAGPRACLRILFLVSAHNSLSQRVWTELTDLGHKVAVNVTMLDVGWECYNDTSTRHVIVSHGCSRHF